MRTSIRNKTSPTRCECGHSKRAGAKACHRCLWLDGWSGAAHAIIGALRVSDGPLTLIQLEQDTAYTSRQLLRTLDRLLREERVRKLVDGRYIPYERHKSREYSGQCAHYVLSHAEVRRAA